jgi:hypothetical protein
MPGRAQPTELFGLGQTGFSKLLAQRRISQEASHGLSYRFRIGGING